MLAGLAIATLWAVAAPALSALAAHLPADYRPGEWQVGRATFFDGPASLKSAYAPYRQGGAGAWGDLFGAACGFAGRRLGQPQSNDDLPFPHDAVGALSDFSFPTAAGSCGQCYEVRCRDGFVPRNLVAGQRYEPTAMQRLSSNQTMWEAVPGLKDSIGRKMPAESVEVMEGTGVMYTTCWNKDPVLIHIIDTCPCLYCPSTCRLQQNCCADTPTMDLSYWAFDKLAHPAHGIIGIEWRPVDCATRQPLDLRQGSKAWPVRDVYTDQPNGWAWYTWEDSEKDLMVKGAGLDGSNAVCLTVGPGGGMAFYCRGCHDRLRPFSGAKNLSFWVRLAGGGPTYAPPVASANATAIGAVPVLRPAALGLVEIAPGSTPAPGVPGQVTLTAGALASSPPDTVRVPDLKVFLSQSDYDSVSATLGAHVADRGCDEAPVLSGVPANATSGDWTRYALPMSSFRCNATVIPNKITFQFLSETPGDSVSFCLDDVVIE